MARNESAKATFLRLIKEEHDLCLRILGLPDIDGSSIKSVLASVKHLSSSITMVTNKILTPAGASSLLDSVNSLEVEANRISMEIPVVTCYQAPLGNHGKFQITYKQLHFLASLNMSHTVMATALQVSPKTIKRRLREFNIKLRDRYAVINDEELDSIVKEAIGLNRNIGSRSVRAKLQAAGKLLPYERVRSSVIRVDPVGVTLRSMKPKVHRWCYRVACPNALWHIDGNHKLIRYGIVVHGAIDGASRMLVFLAASNNNKSTTVVSHFIDATTKYGLPSRIRVDQGVENNGICFLMEAVRGSGRGSALRGKSCHNQRIERAWVDVWNGVTNIYYNIFNDLENKGCLDPSTDIDLWVLQQVFLPRINADLEKFVGQWNHHGLRTAKNKSPMQLFVSGILAKKNADLTAIRDIMDSSGIPQNNSSVSADQLQYAMGKTSVRCPDVSCPLSTENSQTIVNFIKSLPISNDSGFDHYLQSLIRSYELMNHQ